MNYQTKPQTLDAAILFGESLDSYVIRVRFELLEFEQIISTVAAQSLMLLGRSGDDGPFRIIDAIFLSEPVHPDQIEAVFEGPEIIYTLYKMPVRTGASHPKVDSTLDFAVFERGRTSDAGKTLENISSVCEVTETQP